MAKHASPIQRLGTWLETERRDLWVLLAYSLAIGLLTLVVPIATQSMVNTIAFGTLLQPLVVLASIVLLALGFSSLLRAIRTWVVEIIQRRIFVRISSDAVQRLLRVRIEAFDEGHGPELVNRFFEVVTVQKGGSILLIDGLAILIQTITGLVLLAVYHPLLLAFGVVIFSLILVIIFPLGRGAVNTAIEESKAKFSMAAWLEELARHPAAFKSPAGVQLAMRRANALVEDYLIERRKHFRILFRQIASSLALEALASAVLLAGGGWLVIQRQLTLGQLVAAELIVAVVVGGFAKFGKQLETFYDLLAAVDKLGYLTDLPLESDKGVRLPDIGPASLRLRKVTFSYDGKRNVIDGLDAEIPAGSQVVLYSGIGEGKSTLIDLLYRFRTPTGGTIEIDGLDYREVAISELRKQVALVRHVEIFQGTVLENIRLGNESITVAEARDALERVGLLDQIRDLPDGLDSPLSTGGLPLSQGQARRLMFARAVAQKPRLLVVDEAVDAIEDTPERERLLVTLFDHRAPWTLIVATRHPELASRCSRVLNLKKGAAVEEVVA